MTLRALQTIWSYEIWGGLRPNTQFASNIALRKLATLKQVAGVLLHDREACWTSIEDRTALPCSPAEEPALTFRRRRE